MIPKDNGARGPPIGVITPIDQGTNNNTSTQAILSVYKSYKDFSTITGRRHSSSTAATTAAPTSPPPPPPPAAAAHINDSFHPKNTTLCTLSIPSYMSIPDFLNFVAPVDTFVTHYRVLCDGSPQTYLVLMTFRDEKVGRDYYKQYNKRKFSSMEDQVCEVVYIKTITIMSHLGGTTTGDPYFLSFLDNEDGSNATTTTGIQNNCPVCLDPMDESVTGLLTTLCQHTFHVHCLTQWGDGSCPVCRYSQKPIIAKDESTSLSTQQQQKQHLFFMGATIGTEQPPPPQQQGDGFTNVCHDCGATTHLWICLVCGHIGCGQEHDAHALAHYTAATNHVYALDIDSQRVWDYVGDNYVHRLIQNAVDGKLVELPQPLQQQQQEQPVDASLSEMVQGKLNAMALEYSYLLTSQLDSQRMYYEDRINTTLDTLAQLSDGCKQATRDLDRMHSEALDDDNGLAEQVEALRQHNTRLVHKVAQWKDKSKLMERNYLEEKELTRSISQNNALVKDDIDKVQHRLDDMAAKSAKWMACLEQEDASAGPSS